MGTELPTNVMFGQTLVLMQMTFLNNVRNVVRLVLSRTSCLFVSYDSRCKQRLFPLNSVIQLIFVMVKHCVFFAVRTEFLNVI
jgi:hypothetical protein